MKKEVGKNYSNLVKAHIFMPLLTLALGASFVLGTAGCDSDDARLIGGTIAIVAGAAAIGSTIPSAGPSPRPPARCHGDYREVCRSTRDRFGRVQRSCRREWDSCARRYDGLVALNSDSALAMKYAIPLESASKLNAILEDASRGNGQTLEEAGFNPDELVRISRFQLPSDAALEKLAVKLDLSRSVARDLVQQLIDETKMQMADVNSAAWANCQASGKWKTDANGGTCKSLAWAGCSPETGASVCAAL